MRITLQQMGGFGLAAAALFLTFANDAKACTFSPGHNQAGIYSSTTAALVERASAEIAAERRAAASETSNGSAERSEPDPKSPAIVGMWQVTVLSEGQVTDQAYEVFHSDGTEMINDITPPAEENVCLGVWAQTGPAGYKLKHLSWTFDSNGNLTGTAVLKITISLKPGADKFNGTYTLDYFDTNGSSQGEYTGQVEATRVTVD